MEFETRKIEHDLEIKNVANNSKDSIKQPEFCESKTVPRMNTSTLIVGRSGSGKSVLLTNILKECYKDAFQLKVLISPTAATDDVQKAMGADIVVTDLKEAIEFLEGIMKVQERYIKERGADKAPLICVIFDDVMGETRFLNSPEFTGCFTRSRHFNMTIFCLTQKFTGIPKRCRVQANNLIFFKGQDSEVQGVADDFCPTNYTKKDFSALIKWATSEPHAFLYINMSAPEETRYRKNFDHVIVL